MTNLPSCMIGVGFWDLPPDRRAGAELCCAQLERMTSWMRSQGFPIDYRVFDGTVSGVMDGPRTLRIPGLAAGGYYRSIVWNYMIRAFVDTPVKVLGLTDSDVAVRDRDWPKLLNILRNFGSRHVCSLLLNNLPHIEGLTAEQIDMAAATDVIRGPACAGMFYTSMDDIVALGGFDERFTVWGCEDNDLWDRLGRCGTKRTIADFNSVHVFHSAHPSHPCNGNIDFKVQYWKQRSWTRHDKSNVRNAGPLKAIPGLHISDISDTL